MVLREIFFHKALYVPKKMFAVCTHSSGDETWSILTSRWTYTVSPLMLLAQKAIMYSIASLLLEVRENVGLRRAVDQSIATGQFLA